MTQEDEDFFTKFGLGVKSEALESLSVGQTCPIYGMITKILESSSDGLDVEVNYSMKIRMAIREEEQVELLKSRAFEPGIFVVVIDEVAPKELEGAKYSVLATCKTVIFGRRKELDA